MKNFEFTAFNLSGEKRRGVVRAANPSEAKRKIQRRGLYPSCIQDAAVSGAERELSLFQRVKEFIFYKERMNV